MAVDRSRHDMLVERYLAQLRQDAGWQVRPAAASASRAGSTAGSRPRVPPGHPAGRRAPHPARRG